MAIASLNEFIPQGCIQFSNSESFIQAASEAAELLSKALVVGQGYPAEVSQIIREKGPYMVVAPQVAIVHGRPGDDSKISAASVLISGGDLISGSEKNDPVRVIFAISASSNEQHLELLKSLSSFLLIEGVVDRLQVCSTVSEVRRILLENLQ